MLAVEARAEDEVVLAFTYLKALVESEQLTEVHGQRVAKMGDLKAEDKYDTIRDQCEFFSMDLVIRIRGEFWLVGCNYRD